MVAVVIAVMAFGLGSRVVTANAATTASSGWFRMYDAQTGKCLDNWSSYTEGTQIRQYNCYNGAPQMWQTIYWKGDVNSDGWTVFRNEFSGQCIWVSGNHTYTNGEPVVQEPCNLNFNSTASTGENWYFELDTQTYDHYLSAVCTGQSGCGGSYGSPTNYFLQVSTNTNGAGVTIIHGGAQDIGGIVFAA